MREYGAVVGAVPYEKQHKARYRAQSLIRLLVELRMFERWELAEHVDRKDGGFVWTVEYVRRPDAAE